MKPTGEISLLRTNVAIGLISDAIIAFQLALFCRTYNGSI